MWFCCGFFKKCCKESSPIISSVGDEEDHYATSIGGYSDDKSSIKAFIKKYFSCCLFPLAKLVDGWEAKKKERQEQQQLKSKNSISNS